MNDIIVRPGDIIEIPPGIDVRTVSLRQPITHVSIAVDTLETLVHGCAFARDVAGTLHTHFNDPAMQRAQKGIHDAMKEGMRLVGIARAPK